MSKKVEVLECWMPKGVWQEIIREVRVDLKDRIGTHEHHFTPYGTKSICEQFHPTQTAHHLRITIKKL